MANEKKKHTGTTDPPRRPNQPGQNPSTGSSGYQPGQQNPDSRRSDEWSDKGGTRPNDPNHPSRQGDDDMDEGNPA